MIPSSGFNGTSLFDMEVDFSLSNVTYYLGGVVSGGGTVTGNTDFTALFEEWRIDSIEVAIMYGANAIAPGPVTGPQSPILIIAFDPNDLSATSLSSILQVNGNRIIQIANIRGESGFVTRFRPRVQAQATTVASGKSLLMPLGQWVSTDAPTTSHLGLKVFYDNAASTYAQAIGTLQFYFKIHYSFQHTK